MRCLMLCCLWISEILLISHIGNCCKVQSQRAQKSRIDIGDLTRNHHITLLGYFIVFYFIN